jgi:rhodanese-related sulfurtransferase
LLVDVREREEVEALACDVPSILHIPLSEFEARFAEIPQDKDIVVVCKSGSRSLRAAGFLARHGYARVAHMQHGIARWVQKGFPVIGDAGSLAGDSSCC